MLITLNKIIHVHSKWDIVLKPVLNFCWAVYYGIVMGLPINVTLFFICWFLLLFTDNKLMNLHINIISEYTAKLDVIYKIRLWCKPCIHYNKFWTIKCMMCCSFIKKCGYTGRHNADCVRNGPAQKYLVNISYVQKPLLNAFADIFIIARDVFFGLSLSLLLCSVYERTKRLCWDKVYSF